MAWTLLAFVFLSASCVIVAGTRYKWPKEVYYFAGFSMLLLSSIYGVTVLNWEIAGSGMSVKKAKEEVKQARDDVFAVQRQMVFISTSTIELTNLAADCATRFGGCSGESKNEIVKKQSKLLRYIDDIAKAKTN